MDRISQSSVYVRRFYVAPWVATLVWIHWLARGIRTHKMTNTRAKYTPARAPLIAVGRILSRVPSESLQPRKRRWARPI